MRSKVFQVKHLSDYIILRTIADHTAGCGATPDAALADFFPLKVIVAKMEQCVDRGLIEYGVSLRTAWLTDTGKELLEILETHPEILE